MYFSVWDYFIPSLYLCSSLFLGVSLGCVFSSVVTRMNGAHCLYLCLCEEKWNRTLRRHKVPIRYRRETQRERVRAEYDRCMHKGDAHRNTQYAEELREFGYRWASTGFQFLILSKWMGEMWRSQANVSLPLCFGFLFFAAAMHFFAAVVVAAVGDAAFVRCSFFSFG